MLRHEYMQTWDLAALAKHLHSTPSKLARAFRHEYGRSPRTYQRILRLVTALERVRDEKIESIALDLGYRSRKNFNRALHDLTGVTPTEFRALPRVQAQEIIDGAHIMLTRPAAARPRRESFSRPVISESDCRRLVAFVARTGMESNRVESVEARGGIKSSCGKSTFTGMTFVTKVLHGCLLMASIFALFS